MLNPSGPGLFFVVVVVVRGHFNQKDWFMYFVYKVVLSACMPTGRERWLPWVGLQLQTVVSCLVCAGN